ncbi:MAG: hypothetical protein ACLPVW_00620 [Terriglobales bacterium]
MSKVLNRTNALLAFIAIAVLPVIWWLFAAPLGKLVARYDVARGHYTVFFYGLPASGFSEYKSLLHDRYGIELEAKGCVITSEWAPYVEAHNREIVAAANRRFGHDVFKECQGDAMKKFWENRKAEWQKSATASEEVHPTSSR